MKQRFYVCIESGKVIEPKELLFALSAAHPSWQDMSASLAQQPCGHPLSAIVDGGHLSLGDGTKYCGQCADDSLRANIAAGIEA